VALEGKDFDAGGGIPDLQRIVSAAGDDAPAVGADGRTGDSFRVALDGKDFAPIDSIPKF
jgi:hypothetical protein